MSSPRAPKPFVASEIARSKWVAAAAAGSVILYLLSVVESTRAFEGTERGIQATQLIAIEVDGIGGVMVPAVMQTIAVLLLGVPFWFLYRAARNRSDDVRGTYAGFYFLGPILVAAQFILFALAIGDVSEQYAADHPDLVEQARADGVSSLDVDEDSADEAEAEDAGEDVGLITAAEYVRVAGFLCFGIAIFYAGIWSMRTGLLTRFNGSFAMTNGVVWGMSFFFGGLGLMVTTLWAIYLAIFFGRGVHTRPPAWGEGRAIPWPAPGEEPDEGSDPGLVEGEGREVTRGDGDGEPGAEDPGDATSGGETQGSRRKRKRRG